MSIAPIILCVALFRAILFVCLFAFVRACACECVGDHNETSIDSRIDKGAWSKRRMEDRAHWCIPWWLWLSCVINDIPSKLNCKTCQDIWVLIWYWILGDMFLKAQKLYTQYMYVFIFIASHLCIYCSSHSLTLPSKARQWLNLLLTSSSSIIDSD